MTSDSAYVWIWLPGHVDPIVAGRIDAAGTSHTFTYGRSYLDCPDSIPLYLPELPLQRGVQRPDPSWEAHGCLQDAGPDYWGRRVILAQHFGHLTRESDTDELPFLTIYSNRGRTGSGRWTSRRRPPTTGPARSGKRPCRTSCPRRTGSRPESN